MKHEYTLKEIESMPTISQSQFDDLKYEDSNTRVWLSRMSIEDGQPYNNQITIEKLMSPSGLNAKGHKSVTGHRWEITKQYEAK